MTLIWRETTNFNDDLYELKKEVEANTLSQRLNLTAVKSKRDKNTTGYNPTIGVGFDLYSSQASRRYVYIAMGFDRKRPPNAPC